VEQLSKKELIQIILELRERVAVLEKENAELRARIGGGGDAAAKPEWVKPNRRERREAERAERKNRMQSFTRKRDIPTEVIYHAVETCPDCERDLTGGWVHDRRQVIELPQAPVRVIEHVLIARRCGVCGKRHIPKLELSGQVIGKCRFGIRLMSVITSMAIACRMPYRVIKKTLESLYGLKISVGEIAEILHKVAERGKDAYDGLLSEVRGSPVVNADETGWREDGINGYIWSFSTPSVRYFLYQHSRASAVVKEALSDEFAGVLVSDFYCAYNVYEGVKQRCWVHLLRDLHALVEKHPNNKSVANWAESVKKIYKNAKDVANGNFSQMQRVRARQVFESRLLALATPYLGEKSAPQRVLAKRIDGFLGELFTFVDTDGVPSENNAAERAVRPAVIARKVSGGSRSPKGSTTRMTLMSLLGTWNLRGVNSIDACVAMLAAQA
jgi:transposase